MYASVLVAVMQVMGEGIEGGDGRSCMVVIIG